MAPVATATKTIHSFNASARCEMKDEVVILKLYTTNTRYGCGIAPVQMSKNAFDDKSTSVDVMAWCRQAMMGHNGPRENIVYIVRVPYKPDRRDISLRFFHMLCITLRRNLAAHTLQQCLDHHTFGLNHDNH